MADSMHARVAHATNSESRNHLYTRRRTGNGVGQEGGLAGCIEQAARCPESPEHRRAMIAGPDTVYRLATERESENRNFLKYLRYRCDWSSRRLARLQRGIVQQAWAEIDCSQCANCCRGMHLQVSLRDCRGLARALGLRPADFRARFVERRRDGHWYLRTAPCGFLNGNQCAIYPWRPSRCRGFPYLGGTVRDEYVSAILEKARYCPVVLYVLEELRAHLDLAPRRRKR